LTGLSVFVDTSGRAAETTIQRNSSDQTRRNQIPDRISRPDMFTAMAVLEMDLCH
jgi:hypothetical protein